jgi:hypothetical protein
MADLTAEILLKLRSGQCTVEEAQQQLAQLKIGTKAAGPTYKVSPKGGISFYGIRKLPITLYLEELQQIMKMANTPEFQRFIDEHKSELSTKEKKKF